MGSRNVVCFFPSQNDATVKVIPKNVWLLLRNFISPSHLEVLKTFFAALEEKSVPVVSINQLIIYHELSGFHNLLKPKIREIQKF